MRHSLAFALLLIAAPVAAQQAARTIAPGMTKTQVVTALGQPATARTVSDYTYMFYTNTCGRRCGMNDLVVLHGDSVVDAIFRSPNRHYRGTSSSPAPIAPEAARKQAPSSPSKPVQMKPGPANDTRPSIPLNPPATKPAPTKPESQSL
ncbi:MAG: outer membrane protein assembly factor BamE [Gemmatimonadaceae bacterium]